MNKKIEILEVLENKWLKAQGFERDVWIKSNQRNSYLKILLKFASAVRHLQPATFFDYLKYRDFCCGDDWNYWWMKEFENYRKLPKSVENALEIGCGPYTNIRLISKKCKIKEIYCCDPLIDMYISFKATWLSTHFSKKRIKIFSDKGENLRFDSNYFDLLICINVLSHVQNVKKCLQEIIRVTKQGGFIVLGQGLSNEKDLSNKIVREDIGHPMKIHHTTIDTYFDNTFISFLKKILPRNKGRNPFAHYGTYIFIGQKK